MPREPLRLATQGEYNPDTGIKVTQKLKVSDVGNIRIPDGTESSTSLCPPGTIGIMNTSMADYLGDPYTLNNQLNPGKPSNREIYGDIYREKPRQGGLAFYYGVGGGAVKRWFNMRMNDGTQSPRNCVSADVIGSRFYLCTDNRSGGNAGTGQQERMMLALGLCVDGGLKADPWYTKGGGPGRNIPFVYRERLQDVAACVRYALAIYDGRLDDIIMPPASSAWIQLSIEPSEGGRGWEVVMIYLVPMPGIGSDLRPPWAELPQY